MFDRELASALQEIIEGLSVEFADLGIDEGDIDRMMEKFLAEEGFEIEEASMETIFKASAFDEEGVETVFLVKGIDSGQAMETAMLEYPLCNIVLSEVVFDSLGVSGPLAIVS